MSSWELPQPLILLGGGQGACCGGRGRDCKNVRAFLHAVPSMYGHLGREHLVEAIDGTADDVAHRIRHNDTGRGFPEPIAVNQQINILRARLGQLGVNSDENLLHRSLLLHFHASAEGLASRVNCGLLRC
jgi:hypothetical protein